MDQVKRVKWPGRALGRDRPFMIQIFPVVFVTEYRYIEAMKRCGIMLAGLGGSWRS